MARKRVVEPSGVKTWEDANDALRQIAEAQLAVQDIEGEMNKQILGAKKAAEEQSKPHKDRIAKLERELKARACNMQTGCFRLLDRTLSNVSRILEERGETVVTVKIIEQASSLMML